MENIRSRSQKAVWLSVVFLPGQVTCAPLDESYRDTGFVVHQSVLMCIVRGPGTHPACLAQSQTHSRFPERMTSCLFALG